MQQNKMQEPWNGYFEIRSLEYEQIKSLLPQKNDSKILEIGCGIGFYTKLLAARYSFVVGTDILHASSSTHSPGLFLTSKNLADMSNAYVAAAVAENLPFEDESFDMIISSYVLEHVNSKLSALNEMYRILKPGGIVIAFVPGAFERVDEIFAHIIKLATLPFRIVLIARKKRLKSKTSGDSAKTEKDTAERRHKSRISAFCSRHYPNFPFPSPHGNYKSSSAEFIAHLPWIWKSIIRKAGFRQIKFRATRLYPMNTLQAISIKLNVFCAKSVNRLTSRFGSGWTKYLAHGQAYIARKPE